MANATVNVYPPAGGGAATEITETGGPTDLAIAAITDNSIVRRSGTDIEGSSELTYTESTKLGALIATRTTDVTWKVNNTSNANANAHAELQLETGGASGGDPFVRFLVSGVTFWSAGVENAVSDQFVIAQANGLSASKALTFQQTTLFARFGGGVAYPITATKTGAYTVTLADYTVPCDATSAAFDVTLPAAAAANSGAVFIVKKIDASANAVTVKTAGGTLDGVAAGTGIALAAQWDTLMVQSNGTNYYLLAPSV